MLRILLALLLVWLLGGLLLPFPRCKVAKIQVASLNALAVDLDVAGRRIYLDMHYPMDKVLLCDLGDDGSNGIPYEHCYKVGSPFIEPNRRKGVYLPAPGFPLSPVKYVPEALGTVLALYGMSGEAMARVEGKPYEKPLLDLAARSFLGRQDTLAVTYIPRLRVEQMIRGKWAQLTQFNLVGMLYFYAPEDTVQIRMTTTTMKVVFLRNRVLVKPATESEQVYQRVIVRRPREGFWPYYHSWEWEEGKEFFKTFQADTLRVGELFEFEFPILPPVGTFSLDVLISDNNAQPYVQFVAFPNPGLTIPGYKDSQTLRNWPLSPTPHRIESSNKDDECYPDGYILPRWAFEKHLEMGFTSGGDNSRHPNVQHYKLEIDLWEEECIRKRQEEKERKRQQRLDEWSSKQSNH